jgi:hypothetical protein
MTTLRHISISDENATSDTNRYVEFEVIKSPISWDIKPCGPTVFHRLSTALSPEDISPSKYIMGLKCVFMSITVCIQIHAVMHGRET